MTPNICKLRRADRVRVLESRPVMERSRRTNRTVGAALLCAAAAGLASAQTVAYTVTDLGVLPASTVCDCFFAQGISQNGAVAGFYFGPLGEYRGFIWRDGNISDVGGAAGTDHLALAVNDDGVTVGFGDALAFRAQHGVVTDLPSLGGPHSDARDINNAGMVVGSATRRDGDSHATMWIGTAVTDLGTLGGEMSQAFAINELGQVVGWAWNPDRDQRAFLWSATSGMDELALPAPDAQAVVAHDINALGQVIGLARVLVQINPEQQLIVTRGFIWDNGVPTDIGDLGEPNLDVVPTALNDAGQVVGSVLRYPIDFDIPFIRQDGVMVDLNTLIDPASGWRIIGAADINNDGMIAASATHIDGRRRAVLLTPAIPACPADLNGDGLVDFSDYLDFLSLYDAGDPRADFSGDGLVDFADYLEFLNHFDAGC